MTKLTYAKSSSLPASLNHTSKADALKQARELSSFLSLTALDMFEKGGSYNMLTIFGMLHAFDLLQDKLAIAAGDMDFPFASVHDDAPELCTIREVDHD